MAHVQKIDSGRWRARYRTPDGAHRSRTFARRVDAEKYLASIETAKVRGEWYDPARAKVTIEQWAKDWLTTRTDLRPSSLAKVESVTRMHVIPAFGKRQLGTISNAEIRAWVGSLMESGLSASTTRKCVFALRQMLDAAIADRRLTVNPALSVPLPAERSKEQQFLDRDEVDALLRVFDPRFRVVVLLGVYGGLRWGEMVGLRRSRIDVLRSRITIAETATEVNGKPMFGEPKTEKSRRVIPIPRRIMAEIAEHLQDNVAADVNTLVLATRTGGPLSRSSFGRDFWEPALKRAGMSGLRIHDLRHTFCSLLISSGADPKQVSVWAGHSSTAFTLDRYTHVYEAQADEVIDRLDAMLSADSARPSNVRQIRGA